MKDLLKAGAIRAVRTVCQALVSMLPVGIVITPAVLQGLSWEFLYVILAWLGTALLAGLVAFLTAISTGLPEVDYARDLYQYHDEPEDSEVEEDEDE